MSLAGRAPDPGAIAFYGNEPDEKTISDIAWGFVNDGIENFYKSGAEREKTGTAVNNTAIKVASGTRSISDAALNLTILANQAARK